MCFYAFLGKGEKSVKVVDNDMPFNEARMLFIEEYDRSNPLTSDQATMEFQEFQANGGKEASPSTQPSGQLQRPRIGGFGGLANY